MTESVTTSEGPLESMLKKLAAKDGVHFKHQTRDEPDLTTEEKIEIAREIYKKSPGNFLSRFHPHLDEGDCSSFSHLRNDYEIAFYLKEISSRNVGQTIKNRRYRAMERLIGEGQYFSLDAMRKRDPLLFEQLVGRYSTQEERQEMSKPAYNSFSGFLLSSIDRKIETTHLNMQKELESQVIEEDDDDEEEMEEDYDFDKFVEIPEQHKALLREEFLSIMQGRFLRGEDSDFDYDSLNADQTLDDHKERDLDCEDRYFDEEDPESVHTLSTASSQNFIPRTGIKVQSEDSVAEEKQETDVNNYIQKVDEWEMETSEMTEVTKNDLEGTP